MSPNVSLDGERDTKLLTFKYLEGFALNEAGKDILYQTCVKVRFSQGIVNREDSKWRAFLQAPSNFFAFLETFL